MDRGLQIGQTRREANFVPFDEPFLGWRMFWRTSSNADETLDKVFTDAVMQGLPFETFIRTYQIDQNSPQFGRIADLYPTNLGGPRIPRTMGLGP